MIVSASRRTDIPAFYASWFMNRVRAGSCNVPNPFNPRQVSRISLEPGDVDAFVFWTRNARPLLPHLDELDERGCRYYFLYTILDYPRSLDPKCPSAESALETFRELAERIGKERVVWRYDPLVFSSATPPDYHREAYARLAYKLRGYTRRSVTSVMQLYRKVKGRLRELEKEGIERFECVGADFEDLMRFMAETAAENGMELFGCAEGVDLEPFGIRRGRCIDTDLLREVFGLELKHVKDASQRSVCGCTASRDIGMYDSCLFGCRYCYATVSFERSKANHERHDPNSPSLLGRFGPEGE